MLCNCITGSSDENGLSELLWSVGALAVIETLGDDVKWQEVDTAEMARATSPRELRKQAFFFTKAEKS